MEKNLNNLNLEINQLKSVLYELMKTGTLTDKKVVQCSMELDELILKYQQQKMSN
ncbi:aspartyl-phosphate phosphatase Spo0E family protein [Clostridium tyrobutyricum]|uniref:aspartyl-phosphate phosphatase Spo0E family protein n=1 Tax=Clostridium tyrobutyricum TaxID=1519 RepID=UPI001C38812C|nr:aspartyl-phosphate phosphatase Spo0E family protein [Clostridium tyrobutyricum]MBV4418131.1 aspartyl-phosphate phosphatase Spo0E family protein [Clostridium tyrobutyricum]